MSTQTQPAAIQSGQRRRLPVERRAITHRFNIGGFKGYLIVGLYVDGQPGEIFLRMAKSGSTLAGLLDSLAVAVSLGLQHGISLQTFADKYIDSRYEPSGHTGNPEFGEAASVTDYVFRWMSKRFPTTGATA